MKLIFLDVDGVLNRNSTKIAAPSGCMFAEDLLVKRLQRIYYATNARIVLSSTWRIGWYDIAEGKMNTCNADDYDALASKLISYGIPINGHTPITDERSRSREIELYLSSCENVEAMVILDDIAVKGYEKYQIKTDPKYGLTDKNVEAAVKMLCST